MKAKILIPFETVDGKHDVIEVEACIKGHFVDFNNDRIKNIGCPTILCPEESTREISEEDEG